MKNSWRRLLSLLLVLCLCASLFPAAALAEEAEEEAPVEDGAPEVPPEEEAPADDEVPDVPTAALAFVLQPADGELPEGESYAFSWELSFAPDRQELLLEETDENGELSLALVSELPAEARAWEIGEPGTYRVRAWLGEESALSAAFTVAAAPVDPVGAGAPDGPDDPRDDLDPAEEAAPLPPDGETNATYSGQCGDNLTYTVDNSTLTISGSGDMWDYDYPGFSNSTFLPPWCGSYIYRVIIEDGVTSIGANAFCPYRDIYYYSDIESVEIPSSVVSVGSRAFISCAKLGSLTLPSGLKKIGVDAFQDCTALSSIAIPDTVNQIGDGAFDNTAIYRNSQNWDNGVLYIGNHLIKAQSDSVSGAFAIKPGTKCIADSAFRDCGSLTSVTIPEGVVGIGNNAFSVCSSLTSVTIPASVAVIGRSSFYLAADANIYYAGSYQQWRSLNQIQIFGSSVYLHCSDQTVYLAGYGVFGEGNGLTWFLDGDRTLTVSGSGEMTSAPWSNYTVKKAIIGEGVTSICGGAFSGQRSLTSVEIPASVTSIGASAFSCYSQYYSDRDGSLSRVKLAAGSQLKSIGDSAFRSQPRLQPFRFPNTLESIGSYAFASCTDYVNVTIPDSVTSLGEGAFLGSGVQTAVLPAGVTQIPARLFEGCNSLKSVTIPQGVTKIGESAFRACWNLQKADLPASVTEIGKKAFYSSALRSLDLSHVRVIGDYAFSEVGSWSSQPVLTLDLSSVTSLGKYAFSGGSAIFTVVLNPNTKVIPEGLFKGAKVASITLPDGLTEIGYAAFQGSGLTGITLPGSLSTLGSYAFAESALGRVEIPAGIDEIPQSCFYRCSDLRAAIVPATVEYFGANAFAECPLLTLYGVSPSPAKDYASENGIPFKLIGSAPAAVSSLKLSAGKLTMDGPNTQKELTLSIQPSGAVTGAIQWTSSDSSVVYVYEKSGTGGKTAIVYAQGLGTATVTVSAGGLSASCEVTVPARLTGLSLPQNLSLMEGSTGEITVYPNPEQASLDNVSITWKSSNTKVLQVNPLNDGQTAELVGLAPGTATVTVTVGKLSAKTTVTVLQLPVDSLNLRREGEDALLNDGELTLPFASGAKFSLSAEKEPAAAQAKLTWTSSDTKVAAVKDGVVSLKGAGSTVITVRAADSSAATASFRLNVLDLKPKLSAATVTVNSYLEAGTPLEILPAAESEIVGAELLLKKNGAFVPLDALDFTSTEGDSFELRSPTQGKVSYSAYVRAEVWCERIGESVSFELPLKINVVNTAPKVKITLEKVNTFYPDHAFAVTPAVTNGTLKEYILADNSNPYFELDESGSLILTDEAKALVAANPKSALNKQPVVFQVWCEGGRADAPITVSVKPAVAYAKPTVKLGALRFNRFYTDREYPLTLTVNNGEVAHVELAPESSPCFDLDPAARTLSLSATAWARLAANPKAGFSEPVVLNVTLVDVDEVFTVSAKPSVSRTAPKLYLADAETGAKLSALTYNDFMGKDTARFAIFDASTKEPVRLSDLSSASAVFEAAVLDSGAGAAQLQKVDAANPAKTTLTVRSDSWDADLSLSVSFKYEKQPAVSFNAAGKLDLLLRGETEILYTPKITNALGAEVMDIELVSVTDAKGNPVDEEIFTLSFLAELGTARLQLVPGAEIAKAKYNLIFRTTLELDGFQNQMETKLTVTPTQSKLTLKTGNSKLTVVSGGSAYAWVYAQPEGVKLQRLAASGVLPEGLSVSCNRTTGEVVFSAADGMKAGTYSVKLLAEAVGAAEGTAASTLVFKITVK